MVLVKPPVLRSLTGQGAFGAGGQGTQGQAHVLRGSGGGQCSPRGPKFTRRAKGNSRTVQGHRPAPIQEASPSSPLLLPPRGPSSEHWNRGGRLSAPPAQGVTSAVTGDKPASKLLGWAGVSLSPHFCIQCPGNEVVLGEVSEVQAQRGPDPHGKGAPGPTHGGRKMRVATVQSEAEPQKKD